MTKIPTPGFNTKTKNILVSAIVILALVVPFIGMSALPSVAASADFSYSFEDGITFNWDISQGDSYISIDSGDSTDGDDSLIYSANSGSSCCYTELRSKDTGVAGNDVSQTDLSFDWKYAGYENQRIRMRITDGEEDIIIQGYEGTDVDTFYIKGSMVESNSPSYTVDGSSYSQIKMEIRGGNATLIAAGTVVGNATLNESKMDSFDESESFVQLDFEHFGYNSGGVSQNVDNITVANYGASESTVSGNVEDLSGDPVENATVKLISTQEPSVPQARSELSSLSDPTPQAFADQLDQDLDLRDGRWTADSVDRYAAIYTADDFGISISETADLSRPLWREVPDDEPLVVAVGDPEAGGFIDRINEYNRQVPGAIVDGQVRVERLGADGSVTSSTTYNTTEQSDSGLGPISESVGVPYAEIQAGELRPGFYRITVVDSDGNSQSIPYVVRVGSPYELINQYREDAEGQLTERAQSIRDKISAGGITTTTVTTNANGEFSASVPSSTTLVQAQAYKAPDVDTPPTEVTLDNITTAYSGSEIPNGSVYFPSRTYRTEPDENVTIRMVELSAPPTDGNVSALRDRLERLRQQLTNQTFTDSAQLQALENETREQLERTYAALIGPIRANPALREAFLRISGRDSIPTADELSRSELETAIQHASTAMQTVETRSPEEVTQDVADEAASLAWTTPVPEDANVTVWADYSNGTTRPVADEYVTIDRGITGDTVRIEEYPLGTTDPAQVAFRVQVASSEGVTTDTETIRNPTYNGTVPGLRAIDLSTLSPGPDERVRMTLRGEEIRSVTSATVYGPSGEPVASETNASTVSWDTAGTGRYKVRYTVENFDGEEFTSATTVQAGESAQKTPPTVSAREGVLGRYAVVGDSLEDGEISIENGRTVVTAQLPEDADTPRTVHVHTETLTGVGPTADIRIVRGPDQQSIGRNVLVEYHTDRLDADTLVWRGSNEPITRSGATKYGKITSDSDGSTITTYTDASGVAEVRVVGDPSLFETLDHRIDRTRAGIDVPLLTATAPGGGAGERMEVAP